MEWYFLNRLVDKKGKPVRGYMRKKHNIWKEWHGTEKSIEVNSNDNTGEQFCQDEENIRQNEATQVDTENIEQITMIQNMLDLMKANSGIELRGFNRVDRCLLVKWSRRIKSGNK